MEGGRGGGDRRGRERGKETTFTTGNHTYMYVYTSVTNGMLPNIGIGTDVYIYFNE